MSDIMRLHQLGQTIPTAEEVNSSFQPLLERHKEKEQETLQNILSIAQAAFDTVETYDGTMYEEEIRVQRDALEGIVKICQEQMKE